LVNWSIHTLLFPEKEAKSVVLLRRRLYAAQTFREAEPRGFGGLPPRNWSIRVFIFFFFQKKKQKALFCFAEDCAVLKLGRGDPRGQGWLKASSMKRFRVNKINELEIHFLLPV
jgi:hypothetical protein